DFVRTLQNKKSLKSLQDVLENTHFSLEDKYHLLLNWLHAFIDENANYETYRLLVEEAAVELLFPKQAYHLHFANDTTSLEGLKGNHAVLEDGKLAIH